MSDEYQSQVSNKKVDATNDIDKLHHTYTCTHREAKITLSLSIWPKVRKWNQMKCDNIDHDLIEHLKVLQAWNLFWHVVEKVDAVSQVVQVNQHELTSWAFYGKESYAEDRPPQDENHAVADGVEISCLNRVVKCTKSTFEKL